MNKSLAWRGDPAKAGQTGALGDLGTHAFNILEFLSGQRCRGLNAKLTTVVPGLGLDDACVVQLEFAGGADGLLCTRFAAPGHRHGLRLKIVGSKPRRIYGRESEFGALKPPMTTGTSMFVS